MSTWSWISRTRERKALELYIEHVSKIVSVVNHALQAIKAYREGNWEKFSEEWRRVFDEEREADELKRKILAELAEGVFHPIDREEVVRLTITSDDIASFAKAWCRRMSFIRENGLPLALVDKLIEMASNVHESTRIILEASRELLTGHRGRVLELANKIESHEEKVDDLHVEALQEVLAYCDSARTSNCILAKEITDTIENAADKCEEVGDVLRSIALLM
ncbi:MAG: DUF47 family protein [Desulfurococcaceae archaeon]|jgi:predicted phosphate transport protein (TIGR00153 family)